MEISLKNLYVNIGARRVNSNINCFFAVTVMNTMWNVQYRPVGNEPVISFGSGVTWD